MDKEQVLNTILEEFKNFCEEYFNNSTLTLNYDSYLIDYTFHFSILQDNLNIDRIKKLLSPKYENKTRLIKCVKTEDNKFKLFFQIKQIHYIK